MVNDVDVNSNYILDEVDKKLCLWSEKVIKIHTTAVLWKFYNDEEETYVSLHPINDERHNW